MAPFVLEPYASVARPRPVFACWSFVGYEKMRKIQNNFFLDEVDEQTYPLFDAFSPFGVSAELEVLLSPDDDSDCDGVPVAVDSEGVAAAPDETFIEIGF